LRPDRSLVSLARSGLLGDGTRATSLGCAVWNMYRADIAGRASANGVLRSIDDRRIGSLAPREAVAAGRPRCAAQAGCRVDGGGSDRCPAGGDPFTAPDGVYCSLNPPDLGEFW